MTSGRYLIASFLQHFGVRRKSKRMTDAAFETHLMQDGEEILGAYCWEKIEHIEELSMQYWSLRRLKLAGKSILSQIKDAEKILALSQTQRASEVDRSTELGEALLGERTTLFESIEELNNNHILNNTTSTHPSLLVSSSHNIYPTNLFDTQPTNQACHNYCTEHDQPP